MSYYRGRVKEFTSTSGTGTLQLDGAYNNYRTFLDAFGNGNRCYYVITDGAGTYEYGLGTINSSHQLARTTIIFSSSGLSPVNWPVGGSRDVTCAILAEGCLNNGIVTLATDDTTPDVRNGRVFLADNGNPTTITNFDAGINGQQIVVAFSNSNTTIQHNANIRLAGGANFAGTSNDSIALLHFNNLWYEQSRSVNS